MFAPDLLSGRVALVTGASSGLGRHFAQRLAQHGATVVIAARRIDALSALADELAAHGATAYALALDVRDPASVERAVADAVMRAGRVDILVNNAGIALTKPALLTTEDDWRSVIDTNLDGAFRVARAVAQAMADARRGGAIVNIASILALRVAKQSPAYITAKAALLKLTEALALEWAPQAIRVNALAPGYIETELNRDFLHSPAGEALGKRVALRRFGAAGRPRCGAAAARLRRRPLHDRYDDHRRRRPFARRGSSMEFTLPPDVEELRARVAALRARAHHPARSGPRELRRAREHRARRACSACAPRRRRAGLWAPQMPRALGGHGLSVVGMAACYEEMNELDLRARVLQLRGARRRQHDGARQGRHARRRRRAGCTPIVDGRCARRS